MKNISKNKLFALLFLWLLIIVTWIYPIWPAEQALHSSLTFVAIFVLWKYNQKYKMNDRDYMLIVLFLSIHTFGARWLYSYVPYDAWLNTFTGHTMHEFFGWNRNHYDRLVHLMYGVCFTPALISFFVARYDIDKLLSFWFAVSIIIISSVIYEWFEWLVAITLSAQDAEAYNGQQGDTWDAHKDMLLATIGSLMWYFKYRTKKINNRL